ncbi:MAG: ParB/RepB/Spo0J family partition protein [Thermosynechococcaceae cyanobacterium]
MGKLNFKHLVSESPDDLPLNRDSVIPRDRIVLDSNQVRKYFDPIKLDALAETIKSEGVLENLGVYQLPDKPGYYGLIFGERRYQASGIAGLTELPVVILPHPDPQKRLLLQLIENVHHEDLNPLEELEAVLELLSLQLEVEREQVIKLLAEMHNSARRKENNLDKHPKAQQIIKTLQGLNIEWISFATNQISLLKLPSDVLDVLRQGNLEYTKAIIVARIKDPKQRKQLLQKSIKEQLSVRQIREIAATITSNSQQNANPIRVYKDRINSVNKRLSKSKILDDPKKLKELEGYLDSIEELLK